MTAYKVVSFPALTVIYSYVDFCTYFLLQSSSLLSWTSEELEILDSNFPRHILHTPPPHLELALQ